MRPILVVAGLAGAALIYAGRSVSLADGAPASTPSPQPVSDQVKALADAKDPSAAIDAYATALAASPGDVAVPATYLRKMVEFGLPEMAEKQALDVSTRDPNNGLAWAVLAYMDARRDRTSDALTKIVTATSHGSDDPFVLRTAAQLVAWYDARAAKDTLPAVLRDSVEKMRSGLSAKSGFAEPYQRAHDEYAKNPAALDSGELAAPQGPAATNLLVRRRRLRPRRLPWSSSASSRRSRPTTSSSSNATASSRGPSSREP